MFRNNLPSLLLLAAIYLVISHAWRRIREPILSRKSAFLVPASVLLVVLLHGASALKILLILFLNYRIAKSQTLGRLTPFAIWIFNIVVLFANELFEGFPFGKLVPFLTFLVLLYLRFLAA